MDYIKFFQTSMQTKNIKRTGWMKSPLTHIESVADHSFGVSLLALTISLPANIDRNKLLEMAVMHDTVESITGDVISERVEGLKIQMDPKLKASEEMDSAKILFANQPHLLHLFKEHEERITPEAKLLKELDKLEMVFQALDYERQIKKSEDFDEFWINAKKYIKTQQVKEIFDELEKKRKSLQQ